MKYGHIIDRINCLSHTDLEEGSFRLFTIDDEGIFYGIDHDGNIAFAIESLNSKVAPIVQRTSKLRFAFNTRCTVQFESGKGEKYMHILSCYSKVIDDIEAFIRLTDSFILSYRDNNYPVSSLFTSLSGLFANNYDSVNSNQAKGFYAELYTIKYFHVNNLDIHSYWQKKERLNFDFSITSQKKIEVKSTTSTIRMHHFKHEQLISEVYDIYVVSILFRYDDKGLTLKELIDEVRIIARNDFDTLLYIDKFSRSINEGDMTLIKFDEEYTKNNIRFYNAKAIPKFNSEQPEGVSQTEYNSDLSNIPSTELEVLKSWTLKGD